MISTIRNTSVGIALAALCISALTPLAAFADTRIGLGRSISFTVPTLFRTDTNSPSDATNNAPAQQGQDGEDGEDGAPGGTVVTGDESVSVNVVNVGPVTNTNYVGGGTGAGNGGNGGASGPGGNVRTGGALSLTTSLNIMNEVIYDYRFTGR